MMATKLTPEQRAVRHERNVERRIPYIALGREWGWICALCKHCVSSGSICEDGYSECEHPLDIVKDIAQDVPFDCWAFKPRLNVDDSADRTGELLRWDALMEAMRQSPKTRMKAYSLAAAYYTD